MPSLTAPTTLPAYLLDEQYSDSEFAQPYFQKKRPQTHPRRMVTPANDNFTSKLPQSQQHLVQDVSGTFRGIDASKTAGRSKTNVAASGIELKPPTSHTRRHQDDPEVLAAIERLLESVDTSTGSDLKQQ
jgi:hypothetical protein